MIPSENGSTAPGLGEVLALEVGDDHAAVLEQLRVLERLADELQLRERDALVHALEDPVHVRAGLDELGREPQRLRARVRVLEAARVGDDGDVEGLGDLGRQGHAEAADHVAEDLARRRGVRDDQVHVPEARVVVVVVDVDHELRRLEELRRLGARAGSRSRSRPPRAPSLRDRVRARGAGSPSSGMNRYSSGSGTSPARYIEASLPTARSVSVVARSDPSASPSGFSCVVTTKRSWAAERRHDLLQISLRLVSPGESSSISLESRTPCSIVGSYSKPAGEFASSGAPG